MRVVAVDLILPMCAWSK